MVVRKRNGEAVAQRGLVPLSSWQSSIRHDLAVLVRLTTNRQAQTANQETLILPNSLRIPKMDLKTAPIGWVYAVCNAQCSLDQVALRMCSPS